MTKRVVVGDTLHKLSVTNRAQSKFDWVYDTGELPLPNPPAGGVSSISVSYRPLLAPVALLGWRMDWLSYFLLVSLAAILIAKKLFAIA